MLTYPIHLSNGPGPLLAFLPEPDPDGIAAAGVALANTDGGAIVIGLDSRGIYTGPVDGASVARARRDAAAQCSPAIALDHVELAATPSGPVVAIRVERGSQVHALPDGRVMVRAGSGNRALSGDEIRALIATRTHGEFETETVPRARPSDLDPERLADLLVRCGEICGDDDLLLAMGAVTPEARVTVAGMLLLGHDPQRWLPHSGARFIRLIDGGHVAFEQSLRGPLIKLVDDLWDLIRAQMRTPTTNDALDYPEAVVREALVNAVCHRDYRRRGDGVTVRMFPDRLEISSPGGLPGFLTTQYLLGGRFSRNPRLNWGMFQWGYVEEPGQGILRMITGMDGHGAQPTEILAERDRVNVRLFRAGDPRPNAPSLPENGTLNERQYAAFDYVRQHGSITLHEYRTLCPAVQSSVLQRDLRELVASSYLRKIGSRAGAYYMLP
ncbi:MAG: hypothetical protein EHM39_00310 [Chloroflexi bacterium]|nr:MAG: hypothetical protein EHM39_00310 [Chloroflexota bacterium]